MLRNSLLIVPLIIASFLVVGLSIAQLVDTNNNGENKTGEARLVSEVTLQSTKKEVFFLSKYLTMIRVDLPFIMNYYASGQKPALYAVNIEESQLLVVSGDGRFWTADLSRGLDSLTLRSLKTNFFDFAPQLISQPGTFSIKDVEVLEELILVSFTREVKDNCFNTSILQAKKSNIKLYFSFFFTYSECIENSASLNAHLSGGKISKAWDKNILFGVGDYQFFENCELECVSRAQRIESKFGKILLLGRLGDRSKTLAIGTRNPQGILYSKQHGFVLITEHGPAGGDEVNLLEYEESEAANFGWPISSYGLHYDSKSRHFAPLHKSHRLHGFREPLIQFTPSISISRIIECYEWCRPEEQVFIVGSLGHNNKEGRQSLLALRVEEDRQSAEVIDTLVLNARVRDLRNSHNGIVLTTEAPSAPAIIFIR